jgi:hypothetical protein
VVVVVVARWKVGMKLEVGGRLRGDCVRFYWQVIKKNQKNDNFLVIRVRFKNLQREFNCGTDS